MKFRKLFVVCASLIILTPTLVRAQMSVRNGNTIVETDGNGRVTILTDKTRISTSDKNQRYRWWRSSDNDNLERRRHGRSCHHTNRQTTRVHGSHRRVTQTNTSRCD